MRQHTVTIRNTLVVITMKPVELENHKWAKIFVKLWKNTLKDTKRIYSLNLAFKNQYFGGRNNPKTSVVSMLSWIN